MGIFVYLYAYLGFNFGLLLAWFVVLGRRRYHALRERANLIGKVVSFKESFKELHILK